MSTLNAIKTLLKGRMIYHIEDITPGTRSKIFNEIVLKDNHLLNNVGGMVGVWYGTGNVG